MSDGSDSTPQPDATLGEDATPRGDATAQAEQAPIPEPERASAVTSPSERRAWVPALNIPLSRVQVIVGLTAGLLSISGFLYPALRASRAPLPLGEVVTVVHEAGSRRPVTDATVEILTPRHVLVTTLTPRDEGRARHVIKEGTYRVRVTHPRFALEARSIQVLAGTIAEIRFQLSPRRRAPSPPPAAAPSAVRTPAPAPPERAAARALAPRPTSRPTAGAVTAPKPAAAGDAAPAGRQRQVSDLRRTPQRDQSP